MRTLRTLLVSLSALLAACVAPVDYSGTTYQCPDGVTCPDGFSCVGGLFFTGFDWLRFTGVGGLCIGTKVFICRSFIFSQRRFKLFFLLGTGKFKCFFLI